jgi:hypothetical protein
MSSVVLHPRLTRRLVLSQDADGYALSMRPAQTDRERACRMRWPSHGQALDHAAALMRAFPALYVGLDDETGGR